MICRAFKDLTGADARAVAKLMGVYGESPTGGSLVEVQIAAGEIRVTAYAKECFALLAMKIDRQSDQQGLRFEMTDRETGLVTVTERDASGRLNAYRMDDERGEITPLTLPNASASSQQLKKMSEAVMLRLLKTDDAKFG